MLWSVLILLWWEDFFNITGYSLTRETTLVKQHNYWQDLWIIKTTRIQMMMRMMIAKLQSMKKTKITRKLLTILQGVGLVGGGKVFMLWNMKKIVLTLLPTSQSFPVIHFGKTMNFLRVPNEGGGYQNIAKLSQAPAKVWRAALASLNFTSTPTPPTRESLFLCFS